MCAAIPILRVHSIGEGRSFAFAGESFALSVTTAITGAFAMHQVNAAPAQIKWRPESHRVCIEAALLCAVARRAILRRAILRRAICRKGDPESRPLGKNR